MGRQTFRRDLKSQEGYDVPRRHALLSVPSAFQPQGSTPADFHANIPHELLLIPRVFGIVIPGFQSGLVWTPRVPSCESTEQDGLTMDGLAPSTGRLSATRLGDRSGTLRAVC